MDSVRKATQGLHGVAGLRPEDITSEVCKVGRPSQRCTCGEYVDCSDFGLDQEGSTQRSFSGRARMLLGQYVVAHPRSSRTCICCGLPDYGGTGSVKDYGIDVSSGSPIFRSWDPSRRAVTAGA
jgi:hypothetical protein